MMIVFLVANGHSSKSCSSFVSLSVTKFILSETTLFATSVSAYRKIEIFKITAEGHNLALK